MNHRRLTSFSKMCYQSSDNESITKYYNLDFICFCVNVNSYFSLAEKTVTASFFLYNHIDLRRQSAAEGQVGYSGMCEKVLKTFDYTTELSYK